MVKVRSLNTSCFQTLVTLDSHGANVLIDVGWDEKLNIDTLTPLIDVLSSVDIILLTHSSISHIGAFSYLRAKYPQFRQVPAFATLPVIRLGMLTTLDAYRSVGLCGPFDNKDSMEIREIEAIWSEVNNVKYSQPVQIHTSQVLEGTIITAFNAGHSLGGSLWKIADGVDNIVVGLEWNHARDAHLSGAFLEPKTGTVVSDLQKPSLLITSTNVGSGVPLTKARQLFLKYIDDAIGRGGTVLLPTSVSRSLELLLILEKHMSAKHGSSKNGVPFIFCSHYGKQALTQAAAMLEWMVPSIMSDWQVQNESPFEQGRSQHVQDINNIAKRWPNGPKVILATGECLESGFSQQIFLQFVAQDPNSTVILTELMPPKSLASMLQVKNDVVQLTETLNNFQYDEQKPLTGKALNDYRKRREQEREKQEQAEALERRNLQLIDTTATAQEDNSEEDSDTEENDQTTNVFHGADQYDYTCKDDSNLVMFPTIHKRRRMDEYGEYLPHGLFVTVKESKEKETANEEKEDETEHQDSQKMSLSAEEELQPMKIVKSRKRNIKLACYAVYADMNGLTNLRSMEMILKQVHPAKLVALPNNEEVCKGLSTLCKEFAIADEEVSFERTNFSVNVRIDQSLKVRWKNIEGGYSVARVGGTFEFDSDRSKRQEVVMVGVPKDKEPPTEKVTIGDLKLTALRAVLSKKGMKSEFKGQGVLVCADKVIVRKEEGNNFVLEGKIEPEYYIVRDAIRQFVALV